MRKFLLMRNPEMIAEELTASLARINRRAAKGESEAPSGRVPVALAPPVRFSHRVPLTGPLQVHRPIPNICPPSLMLRIRNC